METNFFIFPFPHFHKPWKSSPSSRDHSWEQLLPSLQCHRFIVKREERRKRFEKFFPSKLTKSILKIRFVNLWHEPFLTNLGFFVFTWSDLKCSLDYEMKWLLSESPWRESEHHYQWNSKWSIWECLEVLDNRGGISLNAIDVRFLSSPPYLCHTNFCKIPLSSPQWIDSIFLHRGCKSSSKVAFHLALSFIGWVTIGSWLNFSET